MIRPLAVIALLAVVSPALTQPLEPVTGAPATGPSIGDSGEQPETKPFSELDANGDGSIDQEEFGKWADSGLEFTALDTDKDGRLSQKEYLQIDELRAGNHPEARPRVAK